VKLAIVLGMIALQAVQQLLIQPRRVAALHGWPTGVQDVPLPLLKWQCLALLLYSALVGLASGAVFCAVLLRS
jgi:hypothetical protein